MKDAEEKVFDQIFIKSLWLVISWDPIDTHNTINITITKPLWQHSTELAYQNLPGDSHGYY